MALFCVVFLVYVSSAWFSHQTVYGSLLCGVFGFCVVCLVTPSDSIWLSCMLCVWLLCGMLGYPIRQYMALLCVVCLNFVWYAWLPDQTVYGSIVCCMFGFCVVCLVTSSDSIWLSCVLCVWLLCGLLGYPIRQYMALFSVVCLAFVWSAWLPHQTVYGSLVCCVFGFCVVCLVTPSDSIWLSCFLFLWLLCCLLFSPIRQFMALFCVVCLAFVLSAWLLHQAVYGSLVCCVFGFCVVCLVTPSDSIWLSCVLCVWLLCGLLGYPIRQYMALFCVVCLVFVWSVWLPNKTVYGFLLCCVFVFCVVCFFTQKKYKGFFFVFVCFFVVCLVSPSDSFWLCFLLCVWLLCGLLGYPIRQYMAFFYVVCLAFVWSAWLPHQTVYGSLVCCVFGFCVVCLVTPTDSIWLSCMLCVWLLCGLLGYPIRQYIALLYVVCLAFVWSASLSHQTVYCSLVCFVFGFCVVCLVTPSDSILLFSMLCVWLLCRLLGSSIRQYMSVFYVVCLAFVWSAWLPHQTVYGSLVCCVFGFCVVCLVTPSDSIWLSCVLYV